jgi:hypothetical protein
MVYTGIMVCILGCQWRNISTYDTTQRSYWENTSCCECLNDPVTGLSNNVGVMERRGSIQANVTGNYTFSVTTHPRYTNQLNQVELLLAGELYWNIWANYTAEFYLVAGAKYKFLLREVMPTGGTTTFRKWISLAVDPPVTWWQCYSGSPPPRTPSPTPVANPGCVCEWR